MSTNESVLLTNKHILISIPEQLKDLGEIGAKELTYITKNFCGKTVSSIEELETLNPESIIIYLLGDVEAIIDKIPNKENNKICIIEELSYNFDNIPSADIITIGQVPINIHNVGVYFRKLFVGNKNYFDLISTEHNFQLLKHSNKPGEAFRKGIYLSEVTKSNDEIKFDLLRCSTNLSGPTDNFRTTDIGIMNCVNNISAQFFNDSAKFNHVLAQIYENKLVTNNGRKQEKKATIKTHSDKTKDMPPNGLIGFTTFYQGYSKSTFDNSHKLVKKSTDDIYDYVYNGKSSVLTRMRFQLKPMVTDPSLVKDFTITLYPNSLFIISLSTNRLYTHEILASTLPVPTLHTRLGYVIRCSKTKAVYKNGKVHIDEEGNHIPLKPLDNEDKNKLTDLYYKENTTDEIIKYGNSYSSMNDGDYLEPLI